MKAEQDQESTQKLPKAIPQGEFHVTIRNAWLFPAASLVAVWPPPPPGRHDNIEVLLLHKGPDKLLAGRIECCRIFDLIKITR